MKNNNKGNIEIVLILLIIITISSFFMFRGILSDQVVIKNTYEYLQYTNCLQSTKDLLIDNTVNIIKNQEFALQQDTEEIDGVIIYSDYYLPAHTHLNISSLLNSIEQDDEFKTYLDINNIEFLSLNFPTVINSKDVYSFPFIIPISITADIQVNKENFNESIRVEFTLNIEISKETDKAIITNISVQDEHFKQI